MTVNPSADALYVVSTLIDGEPGSVLTKGWEDMRTVVAYCYGDETAAKETLDRMGDLKEWERDKAGMPITFYASIGNEDGDTLYGELEVVYVVQSTIRPPRLMFSVPNAEPEAVLPGVIVLTKAEIQSGLDRVRWAELLIQQLPEDHDGRNSWLLNYKADKGQTE